MIENDQQLQVTLDRITTFEEHIRSLKAERSIFENDMIYLTALRAAESQLKSLKKEVEAYNKKAP